MDIGFVGLGIMGSAMATNLLKAGFRVTVWNRSADKYAPLVDLGAIVAGSPRAVAASSDVVIAMMANPTAVLSVRDGEEGIVAGLLPGSGYLDMSTVDVKTSLESARLTHGKGALFLEAPVAGSRKPAEDATLTIMAAGDRELYDNTQPALEKMGKKILFLGDTGHAARMKLANNLVMGGVLTALCEGIALASGCGLDTAQLLEVLDSGAVSNPMFRLKGPQIAANENFPTAFPLKHMQKDLRLALQLAEEVGQPLFATATINELYKKALAEGLGDADFAAVSRVIKSAAGNCA
ncbi:MAG: NAD(P)-dependent oxidoreductase [Desulfuromonadaceae bacterium]|nr:NAD(P)-dependent oxidoreductase [Desulfuromonadaceae bacterium]MDD2846990.1 NAD(P)-dependent oxidoreductase [Desulfuromonadaceae bacterium]MDD4129032.1 NAD(P)-dependent oxidoreductase [Desulfuromonadaceae bacterium]